MKPIVMVYNLKDKDGKTLKEKNLERKHNIPLKALVEIHEEDYCGAEDEEDCNGLRLFVVQHSRDCDGTPLYSLSFDKVVGDKLVGIDNDIACEGKWSEDYQILNWCRQRYLGALLTGFPEECLKVIKLPE